LPTSVGSIELQPRRPPEGLQCRGRDPKQPSRDSLRHPGIVGPTQADNPTSARVHRHAPRASQPEARCAKAEQTTTRFTTLESTGRRMLDRYLQLTDTRTPLKRYQTSNFSIDKAHSSVDLAATFIPRTLLDAPWIFRKFQPLLRFSLSPFPPPFSSTLPVRTPTHPPLPPSRSH
jgi:hypothetical protein